MIDASASPADFRDVRQLLEPLAGPVIGQVKAAILPEIRNRYGWYPDPFPMDFSAKTNDYKVKNAFARLPEELRQAYRTIVTMEHILSREIGEALPVAAVVETPSDAPPELLPRVASTPRPPKSERPAEHPDATYSLEEIRIKWDEVKETSEKMPEAYVESLRMHHETSENKGYAKKIVRMEDHNTRLEIMELERTIDECATNPHVLPTGKDALAATFHAIEKHRLPLPENARMALMEQALNLGDDDLAGRIDAYSTPKKQIGAGAQREPMQDQASSRHK